MSRSGSESLKTGRLRAGADILETDLPPLLAEAEALAAILTEGGHGRPRHDAGRRLRSAGSGSFRKIVDWARTAQGPSVYLQPEAPQRTVWLWVDGSASMRWRSEPDLPEKHQRALVLALALSVLLLRAGEGFAWMGNDPLSGDNLDALCHLAGVMFAQMVSPERGSCLPGPGHHPSGPQVLISDFLMPLEELEAYLDRRGGQSCPGHLLQVLDPAEENMPWRGRMRLEGLEQEGSLQIWKAEKLHDIYAERLAAHRRALEALAHRRGWGFSVHVTGAGAGLALAHLSRQVQTGRGV